MSIPEHLDEWREWVEWMQPALRIALIWFLALSFLALTRHAVTVKQRLMERIGDQRDLRRLSTLASVLRYAATVFVVGSALLMTLGELGISIAPLLATAGVAGIAIGFGAQTLVKDFFTGMFLLIENQIREGDAVDIAGKSGMVERITLRHVRLRDYDGSVHFIPNSTIGVLTNRSREYAYAVVDLNVPRVLELERVFALMREAAEEMRADPVLEDALLEPLDIAGVEKVEDAQLVVRCRLKVTPGHQWRVRREFLRRVKSRLDRERDAAKK